jgi:hypothetical protein
MTPYHQKCVQIVQKYNYTAIHQEDSTAVFSPKIFRDLAHSKIQSKISGMRQTTKGDFFLGDFYLQLLEYV